MRENIFVKPAQREQIGEIAVLFDKYRQFYGKTSDLEGAESFLTELYDRGHSRVYAAWTAGSSVPLGFVQLYPAYSSVSMAPIWVLNDLYVDEPYRTIGTGRMLMDAARALAEETKAKRLTLSTGHGNLKAQKLYESLGYVRDQQFYHYSLELDAAEES